MSFSKETLQWSARIGRESGAECGGATQRQRQWRVTKGDTGTEAEADDANAEVAGVMTKRGDCQVLSRILQRKFHKWKRGVWQG